MSQHTWCAARSAELAQSGSSSLGFPVSRDEFNELKENMLSICKRLEILEQVFVFVDIDKINQAVNWTSARCSLGQMPKTAPQVGTDIALGSGHWDILPASEQLRSNSPTDSGESESRAFSLDRQDSIDMSTKQERKPVDMQCSRHSSKDVLRADSCEGRRSQESSEPLFKHGSSRKQLDSRASGTCNDGLRESVREAPWDEFKRAQDVSQIRPPKRLPPLFGPDVADVKSPVDEEHRSTNSTWDLCSTRDGWNEEADVDPNVFQKFMTQALRPKWESRVQNERQGIDEDFGAREDAVAEAGASASGAANASL